MKIGLIGHSHSVCLMDALGGWRDRFVSGPLEAKEGYSSAFDGWDSGETGKGLIRLAGRKIGSVAADLTCAILTNNHPDFSLIRTENENGNVRIEPTPTLVQACRGFRDCDLIVSIMFGNELSTKTWIDHLPPYDFVEDSLPGPLRPGAQPIDRQYIGQTLADYVGRVLMTCIVMRQHCPRAPIVHVLSPPPLEDASHTQHLEVFAEAMAKFGLIDPRLRLKWYRAYANAMLNMLRQAGIAVMRAPAAAVTDKGFLRAELSEGLTHGNARYGAMLWDAIAAALAPAN